MNKNNTNNPNNPNNPNKPNKPNKPNTEHNPDSNQFKVPPVGSYIPKKTPEQIQMDLLKSFGYGNNEGQQK